MSYKQKPIKEAELELPKHIKIKQEAYDRAGLEYVITAEDRKEMQFLDAVKRRPNDHRKYVKSIYRLRTQKRFVVGQASDEVLIYFMYETVLDFSDNNMDVDGYRGYWWNVDTRLNKNLQGNTAKVQVLGEVPVFEIPFSPEAVDTIMGYSLNDVDQFYVGTASDKGPNITTGDIYQILNKDDFKHGTFQELIDMGRYNFSAKEPRLAKWRERGAEIIEQSQTISSLTNSPGNRNKRAQ